MLKPIASSEPVLAAGAFLLYLYSRILHWTNPVIYEPANFYEPFERNPAAIVALWHGEHFLVPFLPRAEHRFSPLVTTHRDGEIVARAASYYGVKSIRGSGDHGKEFKRKRATRAFSEMLRELRRGGNIVSTADVPKVARVAGAGIVTLAKHSQCPIVPLAMVTSRYFRLSNWDRTCINLPFGRMYFVRGEEIRVPRDADQATIETIRQEIERSIDAVTKRAYELADG
jgi:lysophospholipid acyltransferase (LPLAT)-like uncharacterized protein